MVHRVSARQRGLIAVHSSGSIGRLFLIPGVGEALRVNGREAIIRDEKWLTAPSAKEKRPSVAIAVSVEECFLQCAKALLSSKLWEPHERPDLRRLPCAAEMLADHVQRPEDNTANMQALLDGAYKNNLYSYGSGAICEGRQVLVLIASEIDHAAKPARQIAGSVARCPRSFPILNCPFLMP